MRSLIRKDDRIDGMDVPTDGCEPRELKGWKVLGYSSGIFGQFLLTNITNSFLLYFLIKAAGFNPLHATIGTALGSVTNAFGSPLFGYLSDIKKPGRLGKRRPFLIAGLPLLVTCFILIWLPPVGWDYWAMIVMFWITYIVFYINFGLVRSPYLSMLPEISQVEKNRVKISTLQGIFSILATIVGIIFPMIMQGFLDDPDEPTPSDALFLRKVMPIMGIIFAGLVIFFTLLAFKAVDEKFQQEICKDAGEKKSIKAVLAGIFEPFKDTEYRKWLFSSFSMNTAMRMIVRNLTFFFPVVLFLEKSGIPLFALAALPFAFIGFIFWQKRAKTKGLKATFLQSTFIIFVFLCSTFSLLLTVPPDESSSPVPVQIHAYIIISGVLFSLVGGYILPNPIISAMVDRTTNEDDKVTDSPKSGSYFGSYLFLLNIANAVGDLIVGAIFSGGGDEDPLMVIIVMVVSSFAYLIAVFIFKSASMK
ncbi:MFS transporter [Candidatus Bathyarchaeota archaeon]|nr:MFS transporter [Candidatus Bathyarchaeota archaeon]